MNRRERRLRKKVAEKQFIKPVGEFKQIDLSTASFVPKGMTRAYKNYRYMVMVYDEVKTTAGEAIQALVQKLDDTPIQNHWREMQNIKNKIFGKETIAIEYYPKESQLVDEHNIYWLWIYPEHLLPKPIM
ncbi:hypothetical protein CMU71_14740 [Elizabethkingia anophelis]|nr:hypothetical protein [Elizabethkingia anophelis]